MVWPVSLAMAAQVSFLPWSQYFFLLHFRKGNVLLFSSNLILDFRHRIFYGFPAITWMEKIPRNEYVNQVNIIHRQEKNVEYITCQTNNYLSTSQETRFNIWREVDENNNGENFWYTHLTYQIQWPIKKIVNLTTYGGMGLMQMIHIWVLHNTNINHFYYFQ